MNRAFAQRWLETQCKQINGIQSALFMVPDKAKNLMRPLAKYPAKMDQLDDFTEIVKYAIKKRSQVCIPNAQSMHKESHDFFALPVYLKKSLLGVLVIKIIHQDESQQDSIFNTLKQSIQWLSLANLTVEKNDDFYVQVVGLLAASFEQKTYHQSILHIITELTRNFSCERVAFGEFKRHHCEVIALSNSASFEGRSNLLKKIADAMDEAIEQDCYIVYPDRKSISNKDKIIQRSHQELSRKFGSGSIFTIPLVYQQEFFGAITLLRSESNPFDADSIDLCQQTMALITPFLALKQEQEKNILLKLGSRFKQRLQDIFGLNHLSLKLIGIGLTLLLAVSSTLEGDFRVSADALLEGKIQRVVTAPIPGYLFSASVQAGDTVKQGDLMASLNDEELKLELAKLNGELLKTRREYREAQSTRELVKVSIITEQINQINAEINLAKQQLNNTQLIAPFDGVVIEGDLSQLLGTPVERGDTLFKIAPLEGYRVILKVDETQISYIKPGQTGTLALSSLTQQNYPLLIEKITAVAKADDGANIFRVEASLVDAPDLIRPGMQGVGKVHIGKARYVWIWTHQIIDWFRLWLWSWWP